MARVFRGLVESLIGIASELGQLVEEQHTVVGECAEMYPEGRLGLADDDPGHDPPVLADLAVANEPELLVGRKRTVEEEACGHRTSVLRVSLHGSPTKARNEIQRTGESGRSHAPAPVPLADVATRDPPVRRRRLTLLVRRTVLDQGQLVRSAELAPADAVLPVEHKCRVRCSRPHAVMLPFVVELPLRFPVTAFGVEGHAPAAAKDPIVALHQRGKGTPRGPIEGLDGVVRFDHEAQPTREMPVTSHSRLVPGARRADPPVPERSDMSLEPKRTGASVTLVPKTGAAVLATSERGFDLVEVLAAVVGPDSVERAVGVER
jgi:hypothetical protein